MVAGIRIDMSLTDEHVFKFISSRGDDGDPSPTLKDIASAIGCHINTAWNATERLKAAGRIKKNGGKGRAGIRYEVTNA